jgi:hypothetical protein
MDVQHDREGHILGCVAFEGTADDARDTRLIRSAQTG